MDGRGERKRFGITEDFYGFARCIDNDPAVTASAQMLFEGLSEPGVELAVKVFREPLRDFFAVQAGIAFLK